MTRSTLDEVMDRLPPPIVKIHSEPFSFQEPFIDTVRRFSHLPGTVVLMSGGDLDCARHHILGIWPWMTIKSKGHIISIEKSDETIVSEADPFDTLQRLLCRYELDPTHHATPLSSGLLGYLAYDLKDHLETLPRTSIDDLQLPDLYMVAPSILLIQDRLEKTNTIYLPLFSEDEAAEIRHRVAKFHEIISRPSECRQENRMSGEPFVSPFSDDAYMNAVETIRDYIVQGHVYQVNMSQRFQSAVRGDPFELYASMYADNPAPFFSYIQAGDHQILSTSPERFVYMNGRTVETRPIKGTRPRGEIPDDDHRLKQELLNSPKDDAELSMIVDLLRNDIGKVCDAGSVVVREHRRLEAYENVYHLVSIVTGTLEEDKDAVDLIRATFPGGSITGCPKIRAMEIIDELEPVRRHIYTGSIGYISFHRTMDLSIAIRTATVTAGILSFSVGGGVVYDSIPADEHAETLHKGRTLMKALACCHSLSAPKYLWHNGIFKPQEDASASVDDEGFLYGFGFFETLRVQKGRPIMLVEHLDRFNRAWQTFFTSSLPDITWEEIIRQLIDRNHLIEKAAAVKLLAAAGKSSNAGVPGTLLMTAREYRHRLEGTPKEGLHLVVYPHARHTHLADHKTMNYMFYKTAGRFAADLDADEAVILNIDRSVSETNTANIFCTIDGNIYTPFSEHALPGTMARAVGKLLTNWGRPVANRKLFVDELKRADQVFLTNSLMGAVPVIRIDDTLIQPDIGLCQKINAALLE